MKTPSNKLNNSYPFKHWLLTLILGQVFLYIYESLRGNSNALILIHPLMVLVSAIFSLPAFACYLILFDFLSLKKIDLLVKKIILILFSIFAIIMTFTVITNELRSWIPLFSIASLASGVIFSIEKKHVLQSDSKEST